MTRIPYLSLLTLLLAGFAGATSAADSKAVQDQRRAAHKERQALTNDRSKELGQATKAFREYTRDLNTDFRVRVKELETEFELRRVELKADHDARVAGAEAEYQTKLSSLFMSPGTQLDRPTIERLRAEGKAFADETFALKRQSAEELYAARVENEMEKNALWDERDDLAMAEAESLGLTREVEPILASPIGGGLTDQEERWNERERKEAARLNERNRKLVAEYRNGRTLREWQLANLREDFERTWKEKAELHDLDAEQVVFNALFMQAAQGGQVSQQELVAKMAQINEKKKLIGIEYRKQRDQERIRRREEKKTIMEK